MSDVEIARMQLDRLNKRARAPRKRRDIVEKVPEPTQPQKKVPKINNKRSTSDMIEIVSKKPSIDINSYTIEWDDDEVEITLDTKATAVKHEQEVLVPAAEVQNIAVSPLPKLEIEKRIIKKRIILGHDSRVVSSVSVEQSITPSSNAKKKRSELDNLLGDEGVQMIMRDQQIGIDDNGTLLNLQKASKTRHQRMKQEEPEKTANDWNVCSMIARRRSSSFSTDSYVPSVDNSMTTLTAPTFIEKPDLPKITKFHTIKEKMNKAISDSFDAIAAVEVPQDVAESDVSEELNNNIVMVKKSRALVPSAEIVKEDQRKSNRPKKQTTPKKPASTAFKPKLITVHSETVFVQVKIPPQGPTMGLLTEGVCEELIAVLEQQEANEKCNLLLLGPLKFASVDNNNTNNSISSNVATERRFLAALASFTKPIFVAVQGTVEGVGVTMLPLFDLVFGKYGTEFCFANDPLPGISILMSSPKTDKNKFSELLFLGESLTSTQAITCGLITKEISSKNDKEFEEKVVQLTRECKYTERIRVLKKLWTNSHLKTILMDLSNEASM